MSSPRVSETARPRSTPPRSDTDASPAGCQRRPRFVRTRQPRPAEWWQRYQAPWRPARRQRKSPSCTGSTQPRPLQGCLRPGRHRHGGNRRHDLPDREEIRAVLAAVRRAAHAGPDLRGLGQLESACAESASIGRLGPLARARNGPYGNHNRPSSTWSTRDRRRPGPTPPDGCAASSSWRHEPTGL